MKKNTYLLILLLSFSGTLLGQETPEVKVPDFNSQIAPLLTKYCVACHNADDAEGGLNLESFQAMMKGGKGGAVLLPGRAELSRLVRVIEGKASPKMPPEGNEAPTENELQMLGDWINAGARGPDGMAVEPTLVTPKIELLGKARDPINAVAVSPNGRLLAVAQYGRVEIKNVEDGQRVSLLEGLTGVVNGVAFSDDGSLLIAGAGEAGLAGEVVLYQTDDWSILQKVRGHRDSVYAVKVLRKNNTKYLRGIANLGFRPTFNQKKILLEVHLFNFSGNLYNKLLSVEFLKFIRKEKKFNNINQLRAQIKKDLNIAKKTK